MKVMYLTWGETPRSFGVFGSQVIGQFVATAHLCPNDEFLFLSAVPVLNSSLVRERWAYTEELRKVSSLFYNVVFDRIPIYALQHFFNSNRFTFIFMHMFAHTHLERKINNFGPDVVHCRSYHAAWAALKVKKKTEASFKIVFDARGLWPEEISLKKGYLAESKDYLFLKQIERVILKNADITVSVSDPMARHFELIGCKRSKRVYLSAAVSEFSTTLKRKARGNDRKGQLTLCYVGALANNSWHKPQQLYDLYRKICTVFDHVKLIIVSTSNHKVIHQFFEDVPRSNLLVISTRTGKELASILDSSDIGVLPYFIPESTQEKLLASMVLAVKTAEYLSAGLPVLVNRYCSGAALLVDNNDVGIAYDPVTYEELTLKRLRKILEGSVREKAVNFAATNFDYKSNAERYREIYFDLTQ